MDTLNLNNCLLTFHLVDELESDHIIPYEDEETGEIVEDDNYCEHSKILFYTNSENRISIICEQFRFYDEEWLEDTTDIINFISEDVFERLVNYINTHDNLTIYISQMYGTTSDFVIYTKAYTSTHQQFIEEILDTKEEISYKYLIVNNGVTEKFI